MRLQPSYQNFSVLPVGRPFPFRMGVEAILLDSDLFDGKSLDETVPLGVGHGFLGIVGAALASGNLLVLGFSALLILLGLIVLLVVGVAEIVKWLESQTHRIFRPPETYGGLTATQRGETVRSNSERRIADYFYQNNIGYEYEQDARNRSNSRRISRPDFYLPDYGIYVEYWGMLAAKDVNVRSRYERNMKWKMAQYHQNNIKFISIYPNNLGNLDWIFRAKFREVAGYDLPARMSRAAPSRYCTTCGTAIGPGSIFCQSCGNRVAG